ncbi:MAG: non-heme iron oxygenase ferredoxin subunit [candidate division Zixibacteria bacterium]|jgi:3-phenylpropionate/trans-cinnamate dioxygenase ferredoxin subunit|nr:non-heme iron oxygenase ferredoxin subunit [candidate division Zixibacteria bacterium]
MTGFVKVATVEEVPEGTFKKIEVEFERLVLVHTADGYFALADECTHDGEPISSGFLKRNELICSRHGARFDVRSGAVTRPPALVPLETHEVKVEGDEIFVRLAE